MRTPLLLPALLLALPAIAADDLTPAKVAKIGRDTEKAHQAIDKKYGNKKSSELSSEERKQVIHERAAAEREVLGKHNVEGKEYTRYTMRQTREERAATKQAAEALESKEKAAEADAAKEKTATAGPKEIIIQRGGAGKDPIVMEERDGAPPIVEKGLSQDAQDDQSAASEAGASSQPAAKGKGKGK